MEIDNHKEAYSIGGCSLSGIPNHQVEIQHDQKEVCRRVDDRQSQDDRLVEGGACSISLRLTKLEREADSEI